MDPERIVRWLPLFKRLGGAFSLAAIVVGAAGFGAVQMHPGPKQPIPFSHRLHAGMKGISCAFCHSDVDSASHPGMPPVEKCLLCHNVIIPEFRPVQALRTAQAEGKGVPWNRVNVVPDFVYFNHQIHVSRGFDCSKCHGDVRHMDRVKQSSKFGMGYCVDCHEQNGAQVSCGTCHR